MLTNFYVKFTTLSMVLLLNVLTVECADKTPYYKFLIQDFKNSPKGPFERIMWFCADGSSHPARAGDCDSRGGGIQHGVLRKDAILMRRAGYPIGTVYADMNEEDVAKYQYTPQALSALLLERFFIFADDGWIYQKARYYRGSFQVEDEAKGVHDLLTTLVVSDKWDDDHYLLLRDAVRLLPNEYESNTLITVRAEAKKLSQLDPSFTPLRNKLHALPEFADVARVRNFADSTRNFNLAIRYRHLADLLQKSLTFSLSEVALNLNALTQIVQNVNRLIPRYKGLYNLLFDPSSDILQQYMVSAQLIAALREAMLNTNDAETRVRILQASTAIERSNLGLTREIRDSLSSRSSNQSRLVPSPLREELRLQTRQTLLQLMQANVEELYGLGLINIRERNSAQYAMSRLEGKTVTLDRYREELRYLSRLPSWAYNNYYWEFGEAMAKWQTVEPLATSFIEDRLRSSNLYLYTDILDLLLEDMNIRNTSTSRVFNISANSGLLSLNRGMAKGRLIFYKGQPADILKDHIVIVNGYESDLPPVAGIISLQGSNSLSHIQMLATNLGIPHIVMMDLNLRQYLNQKIDSEIVLVASSKGTVIIEENNKKWNQYFDNSNIVLGTKLEPDLDKLNLDYTDFVSLKNLKSKDSGRIVGPKAAELGTLKKEFPDAVTDGIAIPFGVYSNMLHSTQLNGGISLFDWMLRQYRMIEKSGFEQKKLLINQLRTTVTQAILNYSFPKEFVFNLEKSIFKEFGTIGTFGIFVRSDTNVEDLPNFSGAGLNLTIPNVVNMTDILKSIKQVWASPFTQRAFAWRQEVMTAPEHVYCAVLLMKSVAVQKSGVLVTENIENGDKQWLTVAINEGVGGVVDNQRAEELLINRREGVVRLLASAATLTHKEIDPRGGVMEVSSKLRKALLSSAEIIQLINIVKKVETNRSNKNESYDMEFGFLRGNNIALFQIRPYQRHSNGKKNKFLQQLDLSNSKNKDSLINMEGKIFS
jgi:hypothetical protein